MRIRALRWYRFRVPLTAPFETAHGALTVRAGLLVRLEDDAGAVGWGEVAPLPAIHGADLPEAEGILARWAAELIGAPLTRLERELAVGMPEGPGASAVRAGLDIALLDLRARAAGVPAAALLGGARRTAVPVTATIAVADPAAAARRAREAAARGFQHIKLKVGHLAAVEAEIERVAAVRAAIGPTVTLRLDANGAWSADTAVRVLRALARFAPELIEQPVPPDDLDGLARVRRAAGVPVAADEAVTDLARTQAILEREAADALVIKPMVVGGARPGRAIIARALDAGLRVIVTTTVDTGVGTAAALHLAAVLPPTAPACGLATLPLLAADLIREPLTPRGGVMDLPAGPGLGVTVDEPELERFAG